MAGWSLLDGQQPQPQQRQTFGACLMSCAVLHPPGCHFPPHDPWCAATALIKMRPPRPRDRFVVQCGMVSALPFDLIAHAQLESNIG